MNDRQPQAPGSAALPLPRLPPPTQAKTDRGCGQREIQGIPGTTGEQHAHDPDDRHQRQHEGETQSAPADHGAGSMTALLEDASRRDGTRRRRRSHHSHAPLAVMNSVSHVHAVHSSCSGRPP